MYKGRGGGTIKEHWKCVAECSHGRQEMQSHAALAETHRKRWEEHFSICNTLVLDMVRVVVTVAITPEQVQPPMTSVQ